VPIALRKGVSLGSREAPAVTGGFGRGTGLLHRDSEVRECVGRVSALDLHPQRTGEQPVRKLLGDVRMESPNAGRQDDPDVHLRPVGQGWEVDDHAGVPARLVQV